MKVLSVTAAITLAEGDPIEAMSGTVSAAWAPTKKVNKAKGIEEMVQKVALTDGARTVIAMIYDPDGRGGPITANDKGKQLYLISELNGRKVLAGVKRGGTFEANGEPTHYVFVTEPAKIELKESEPARAQASPAQKPAESSDFGSADLGGSAPAETPAPKAQQPPAQAKDSPTDPIQNFPTERAVSPVEIAKAMLVAKQRMDSAIVCAIELASKHHGEAGKVVGESFSAADVTLLAIVMYNRQ